MKILDYGEKRLIKMYKFLIDIGLRKSPIYIKDVWGMPIKYPPTTLRSTAEIGIMTGGK